MNKIDVLQVGAYPDWDTERLQQRFRLHKYYQASDPTELMRQYSDSIRAIATRGDLQADRSMLELLPNVEIIAVNGVGYDGVDTTLARERGIAVVNTPDVLTDDVADLAVAMMLAQARGLSAAERWVRSGDWARHGMYPLQSRISAKRAGILGLGRIGRATANRLSAFGVSIAYSATTEKHDTAGWQYYSSAEALAGNCDFLFVTLSANAQTRHIVNADVIKALGPSGLLINVSRASNIDEDALITALHSGELGAAALDVFDGEPHLDKRFLDAPNILLQPHHGSGTIETRQAMGKLVYDNLVAHFDGQPLLTPVI